MNELVIQQAINKLAKEANESKLSSKAAAIKQDTLNALTAFCRQEAEFAQAIMDCDKSFDDCCQHCVKGCGSSISDLEVFKRAVEFYFTGAGVEFVMKINLSASVEEDVMNISLTDLL